MKFPINETEFVEYYLKGLQEPEETDKAFATAIAKAINNAYYTGVKVGRKEK